MSTDQQTDAEQALNQALDAWYSNVYRANVDLPRVTIVKHAQGVIEAFQDVVEDYEQTCVEYMAQMDSVVSVSSHRAKVIQQLRASYRRMKRKLREYEAIEDFRTGLDKLMEDYSIDR